MPAAYRTVAFEHENYLPQQNQFQCRLVIPAEVRKRFGLIPGTEVTLTEDHSRLIIESNFLEELLKLRGSLKGACDIDEMLSDERRKERERLKRLERIR